MNLNQQVNGVSSKQRFTKRNPCPVCGGGDDDPRGKSKRCSGYYGDDGRWHCTRDEYAGDLQPTKADPPTYPHAPHGKCECGEVHDDEEDVPAPKSTTTKTKIVSRYRYEDEARKLAFVVVRGMRDGKKCFWQEAPDGTTTTNGIPRILYRLPELREADPNEIVYVPEGEKDVETLRALGLIATTNPQGAKNWKLVADHAREVLKGRAVVAIADKDADGYHRVEQIAATVRPVAKSFRIVEPPGDHKDVTDLIDAGGTINELVDRSVTTTFRSLKDQIASLGERGVRIPTGFETFDTATRGGPAVGRSIIVAGAPGAGKTALVTTVTHQYVTAGYHVALIAADEDASAILIRLGQHEGLDRLDLENGDPDARAALIERSKSWPLLLVEDESKPIETVADELLARAAGGPAVLVLDSVQRGRTSAKADDDTARARVNAVMAALKSQARRGLMVIATSEMPRGSYRSKNTFERIDDLAGFKESGDIEYGADVALVMRTVAGTNDLVDVTMPKNRLGPRTPFRLRLDPFTSRMCEVDMPPECTPADDGGALERFHRIDAEISRVLTETTKPLTSRRAVFLAAKDMGVKVREADFYARLKSMVDAASVVTDPGGWHLVTADGASREEGGE